MRKDKNIIILVFFILSFFNAFSQDECKNLVENKKDEFTKEIKKTSISLIEKGKGHESHLKVNQVNDSIKLTFIDFYYGAAIINSKTYQSKKGDIIYILFNDESVIKLSQLNFAIIRNEEAGMGEKMVPFGYSAFSKSNKILFEPVYNLSKENLKLLSEKKIKKIRVSAKGEHIQTQKIVENIEIELTDENAVQLQKDIQCFIK